MLMIFILAWGKDLILQRAENMGQVKRIKGMFGSNTEIIPHDSNFLSPLMLDRATRQLTEQEKIEWLSQEVYPALAEEGKMIMVNGKYRWTVNMKDTHKLLGEPK